jgi:hypothetical protein
MPGILKHIPLLALWLVGVAAVVLAAFVPDHAFEQLAELLSTYAYPFSGVMTVVIAITLEVAALVAILRPRTFHRSWIRAFIALVVACAFLFFSVAAIMDAPFYALIYAKWAFVVVLILFLVAAWATIESLLAWSRKRRAQTA